MNSKFLFSRLIALMSVGVLMLVQAPSVQATSVSADGFNPRANFPVYALVVQPDGKILVGGDFTTLNGTTRSYIGRINPDGTLDTDFNPGANGSVKVLAVQPDGMILVGGTFTSLGGSTRTRIGRLASDGTLDPSFNPGSGANGTVLSLVVQPDGMILVGGEFTTLDGISRDHIGRLNSNGSVDTSFNPVADGPVNALAIQLNRMILVGGSFTSLGGSASNNIGRLTTDGILDGDFDSDAGGTVRCLAVQPDGKILVGGDFTTLVGVNSRNHVGRLNSDGTLDAFNPNAGGSVRVLTIQPDGKILVGGDFTTLGGTTRGYIGRINPDGSLDAFNPAAGGTIYALATQPDDKILAAGNFTTLAGTSRVNIGRLYPDGSLDKDLTLAADGAIQALAIQPDGKIIVGGSFSSLGGSPHNLIGRLNPDSALDTSFLGSASGDTVFAIAIQPDGKIIVGGSFTMLDGVSRNNIGRLNQDGSLDNSFNPGTSGTVLSLAIQPDGKILVGGNFTTLALTSRNRIGRLNSDGTLDGTFDPGVGADGSVYAIALQPDGEILVGGAFAFLRGSPRSSIGRLNTYGALDSFNPGATGTVYTLLVQPDNKILVGGAFTSLAGSTRQRIGRLNASGTLDTGFNPVANLDVFTIAVQSDGRILVGGIFETLGGIGRKNIGRLNANGTLDTGFNPGANNGVNALAIQSDGKILAGGAFTILGYSTHFYIARLSSETVALRFLTSDNTDSTLTWQISGAGPEISYVTFESSDDGINFNPLGPGTRILGGWQITGQTLEEDKDLFVRARGYYSTGTHNGSDSVVESIRNIYLDTTLPTVQSIVRASTPDPTNASSVDFTVTFSESVTGVDKSDFVLTTTGISGANILSVDGSGAARTVTVNTIIGNGTLRLDVVDNDSVLDASNNALKSGFTSGETYTIDQTAPTISTMLRAAGSTNPTTASSVAYTVTFSEPVYNVNASDFTLHPTDSVTVPAPVTDHITVTPLDAMNYTVTVSSISGSGTLRLDVSSGATIQDLATNAFSGGYNGGEFYTIGTMPIISSSVRASTTDPTNTSSVSFTVTFSRTVTGVDKDDFLLTTTGGITGASVVSVGSGTTTYTVTVNTGSGNGTIRLDVSDDDSIKDTTPSQNPLGGPGAGNGNYYSGEFYTIDKTVPTVTSSLRSSPDPTNLASVNFTVTFSEPVVNVTTSDPFSDFSLAITGGISGASITSVNGSGTTYLVTVNTGSSGSGTLHLNVGTSGNIRDLGNNLFTAGYTSGETYNIDRTAPSVSSSVCANPNPTNAASVDFTVLFTEIVSGVDAADFSLDTSDVVGASITGVNGTGDTRTVTVNTGSGNGTIHLNVLNDLSIVDGAANPLGNAYTGGQTYTIDKSSPSVLSIEDNDSSPTNAAIVGFTVSFSNDVKDVDSGDFLLTITGSISGANVVSVSSGPASDFTVTVSTGSGEGTIRLDVPGSATITDLAGNPISGLPFSDGDYYAIDKTPPDTQIVSHPPDPSTSSSASFTFSSPDDSQATFECQMDGGAFTACPSPKNYTGLVAGGHTFIVRAKDLAGNVDLTPPSYAWVINLIRVFLPLIKK